MKKLRILYSIQCTGNGHLSRSKEIIKRLQSDYEDSIEMIDVCLSGDYSKKDLNGLNVKYKFEGVTLIYEDGSVSTKNTIKNVNWRDFIKSVIQLNLKDYDIIISDFEPVTSWSGLIRFRKVLGVGNQYKFLSNKRLIKNISINYLLNNIVTKLISPIREHISFDYLKDSKNDFFPIINNEIRESKTTDDSTYIVYLSSFSIEVQIEFFKNFNKDIYIFHKDVNINEDIGKIHLRSIDVDNFRKKLLSCSGVITHAGFQLTSECLFLGKKLFVLPIKNQIEQIYNTNVLRKFGVLSSNELNRDVFVEFFNKNHFTRLDYKDEINIICEKIISHRS